MAVDDGHHHHGHPGHNHGHDHEHAHGHERGHGHGLVGLLRGWVVPHSHDPADRIDPAVADDRAGTRAVALSLAVLLATAAVQAAVTAASGSVALLSDTLHNAADALTAVPLWLAFRLGHRSPTRRFTFGYGKAEDLAGLAVVVIVAASAAAALWQAVDRLVHPATVSHLPAVVVAGLVGVAGNEVVAQYRLRTGRRIGSAALEADGHHARADGLASLLVVVAAAGTAVGLRWVDPVVGLVIAAVILAVLVRTARSIGQRLLDAVDPAVVGQIAGEAAGTEGVEEVTEVRARWVGHRLHAQVRLSVEPSMSVRDGHRVAEAVVHRLLHDIPKLSDAIVHVDPAGPPDLAHGLTAHHRHG